MQMETKETAPNRATGSHYPGLHRRLAINSLSSVLTSVTSMTVAFFITPYVLRALGDTLYGHWAVLLSFIGYAGILEMGVQPAVVRLVGHYKAQDDTKKLSELLSSALVFFLSAGGVAALLFTFALPPLLTRYVITPGDLPNTRVLCLLLATDIVLVFLALLFSGIIYGVQKYYVMNWLGISLNLANAGLLLLLLPYWKLMAVVWCKLIVDLTKILFIAPFSRRMLPGVRFQPRLVSRGSIRELLSFGGRVFVSSTATGLSRNSQPVIISTGISSSATTYYVMAGRLADYASGIATAFSMSFMPMFSELQSRKEKDMLAVLYFQYTRYLLLIILAMAVAIIAFGTPFMHLWVGEVYAARGKGALILLTASFAAAMSQPLLWRLFIGVGHLNVLVRMSLLGSGITILTSIILVRPLGIVGVAASVLFASVLTQVLYIVHTCRYFRIGALSFTTQVLGRPFLVAFSSLAFGLSISAFLRIRSYPELICAVGGTMLFHALLCVFLGLNSGERTWLRKQMKKQQKMLLRR